MREKHSGAEWIKSSLKKQLSPLGEAVANLLGDCWSGIYHLETKDLQAVDWSNDHHIEFVLKHKSLATWDSDELTRLVFLAHDYHLRVSIEAKHKSQLLLMFHQRKREGKIWERHPTIEGALELFRKNHTSTDQSTEGI